MESNHLTATLLNVSTGLQPATGNTLRILKHTSGSLANIKYRVMV